MAKVNTRQGLIKNCLRRLGEPVIEVNVDPDQIEDRVDDALQMYQEFHSDATFRNYYAHEMTQDDVDNQYITIPESILYVTKMYQFSSGFGIAGYPMPGMMGMGTMHLGGMPTMGGGCNTGIHGGGMQSFVQMQQYLSLIDTALRGSPLVDFARRQNRLYVWGDTAEGGGLTSGMGVAIECYQTVDPTQYSSVYDDMFMKDYLTALIKEQWGQNMSKFEGMQLPGGVTISGRTMLEEAKQEKTELRERMRLEQEVPPEFFVG